MKRVLTIAVLCALVVFLAGCSAPVAPSDGMTEPSDSMTGDSAESGDASGDSGAAVAEDVTSVTDEFDLDELDALESELDSVDDFTLE